MTSPTERRRQNRMGGWNQGGVSNTERLVWKQDGERNGENYCGNEVMGKGVVHIQSRKEHTSGRHERLGKVRREGRKGDMITKETARKKNPAREKEMESVEQTKRRKSMRGRKEVGGQRERERRGEERMNANREPKLSTEALSFTGGGATIANTFSLALALREIKKQFVFYSYSASLGLFLCLHICKHSFVRAA